MTASSPGPRASQAPPAGQMPGILDDADGEEDVNVLTLAGQIPSQDGEWLLITSLDGRPGAGFLPGLSPHDGRIDLGNLYRLLRALEADDLVRSEWQAEPGPPRRVYRLTASGAGLLAGWARSLRDMRSGIDQFLILYDARR